MAKPIYVLNGPNLNLLGVREPDVYGSLTYADLRKRIEERAKELGYKAEVRQSNHEGELIDWIHEAREQASAIVINAGGLTHTSVPLLDAIKAVELLAIEVHLSNIFARDSFRHHSYISYGVTGVICGLGAKGYDLALEALAEILGKQAT